MKKRRIMLVAAILLLCLLVGCSAQKDAKKDTAGPTEAAETKEARATDTQKQTEVPTEIPTETEENPVPASNLEGVWRSDQEDAPEKGRIIRELGIFAEDSKFMFRCGDPDSEFCYWLVGTWTLEGNQLYLEGVLTDEMGEELPDVKQVKATYLVETNGSQLILTALDEAGAMIDEPGTRIVFVEKPAEED